MDPEADAYMTSHGDRERSRGKRGAAGGARRQGGDPLAGNSRERACPSSCGIFLESSDGIFIGDGCRTFLALVAAPSCAGCRTSGAPFAARPGFSGAGLGLLPAERAATVAAPVGARRRVPRRLAGRAVPCIGSPASPSAASVWRAIASRSMSRPTSMPARSMRISCGESDSLSINSNRNGEILMR